MEVTELKYLGAILGKFSDTQDEREQFWVKKANGSPNNN